ncbi:hypothetical protein HRS9122_09095 [Pyrenophora teres f. teres]|nr:hypothetical protein HRS9122_09095 [Pyrenophora teres f. teres]
MAEAMSEKNELLCRKLRVESACKKLVIATRRLRSAKRGDPEKSTSFYKLSLGELEHVQDAHDALREYSNLIRGSIGDMLRERLSLEIRDMIYDHILPPGEIVVGRMHCGAIALREQVSNEWVNLRQYRFLGDDIVSELVVCLSDVMTDFLATDVYSMNIPPAKFVSKFQILASLGALKALQHPSCVLTIGLIATRDRLDLEIRTPMALRIICLHLGELISSGCKIRVDLESYRPDQPDPLDFRRERRLNYLRSERGLPPRRKVTRRPVILTEKDIDKTVHTPEEMVALLEGVGELPETAPRERAYWKLWLQSIRPKDATYQDAGSATRKDLPAWKVAKAKLEDAMLRIQYTKFPR